ncbi:hypothetical protein RF11_02322 [Thelohanellus kitauei]|uniref:Uncharacterized protein n=1 Tax=Thelohanellus kitauei TaxID=669202 RepID=A0A0C2JKU5_THEKT|nr:hypothetical protein RF11_02322 [Thelohanellus kitauei]
MNSWVKFRTGAEIKIVKRINFVKATLFVAFIAGLYAAFSVLAKYTKLTKRKSFWAALLMAMLIVIQSGFMLFYIRESPFIDTSQDKVKIINTDGRAQTGFETLIVAVIYCSIAYSLIKLNSVSLKKPNIKSLSFHFLLLLVSVFGLTKVVHYKAPYII